MLLQLGVQAVNSDLSASMMNLGTRTPHGLVWIPMEFSFRKTGVILTFELLRVIPDHEGLGWVP